MLPFRTTKNKNSIYGVLIAEQKCAFPAEESIPILG